jgi:hypothetical protein
MQTNALANHRLNRVSLANFFKPKLDQWREANLLSARRRKQPAADLAEATDAEAESVHATEPDSDLAGGGGVLGDTKVPTLDERIAFALEHSPSLNPAGLPLSLLKP